MWKDVVFRRPIGTLPNFIGPSRHTFSPGDGGNGIFEGISEVEKAGPANLDKCHMIGFDLMPGCDGISAAKILVFLD